MQYNGWRCWAFGCSLVIAMAFAGGCDGGSNGEKDTGSPNGSDAAPTDASDGGGDTQNTVIERCGAQSTNGGESGDAGQSDAGSDAPTLPDGFTFEDEYNMRFSDFALDDDSPGSNANSILQDFLDQSKAYPIIVLLHLDKVDPEAGTVDLRGGAGLKVDTKCDPEASDCKYEWDPMSPDKYNEVALDSNTGELKGGLEVLNFVGTNANAKKDSEHRKFVLPIRDIFFSDAYLSPDGDEVVVNGGHAEGYVKKEDAENARVILTEGSEGTKVSDLLGTDEMNYDANGDGDVDSWCLSATFSAKETTIVQN